LWSDPDAGGDINHGNHVADQYALPHGNTGGADPWQIMPL
jgi:hypothetical protein